MSDPESIHYSFGGDCDKERELLDFLARHHYVLDLTIARPVKLDVLTTLMPGDVRVVTLLDISDLTYRFAVLTERGESSGIEITLAYADIDHIHVW